MNLLDLFFPKYCIQCKKFGEYICANCFATMSFDTKPLLLLAEKDIEGVFSAVRYKGVMKKFIYQMKYKPYLTTLIPLAGELMHESIIQNEIFVQILQKKPILVPIPLSKKKLRKRGYNHAELLAKEVGRRFNLEVHNLLERIKETKPQYGLKREERIKNMHSSFALRKPHPNPLLRGEGDQRRIVILVDDVVTTGSTLLEAAKVLKQQGILKVYGLTLAQD